MVPNGFCFGAADSAAAAIGAAAANSTFVRIAAIGADRDEGPVWVRNADVWVTIVRRGPVV